VGERQSAGDTSISDEAVRRVAQQPVAKFLAGLRARWRAQGRGKKGCARAIEYYHDESLPLFPLNVFAKNEKVNPAKAERNEMRKLLPRLIAGYRKRTAK
jgi:hypothetical protein